MRQRREDLGMKRSFQTAQRGRVSQAEDRARSKAWERAQQVSNTGLGAVVGRSLPEDPSPGDTCQWGQSCKD